MITLLFRWFDFIKSSASPRGESSECVDAFPLLPFMLATWKPQSSTEIHAARSAPSSPSHQHHQHQSQSESALHAQSLLLTRSNSWIIYYPTFRFGVVMGCSEGCVLEMIKKGISIFPIPAMNWQRAFSASEQVLWYKACIEIQGLTCVAFEVVLCCHGPKSGRGGHALPSTECSSHVNSLATLLSSTIDGLLSIIADCDLISYISSFDFVCLVETLVTNFECDQFTLHECFMHPAKKKNKKKTLKPGSRVGGIMFLVKKRFSRLIRRIDINCKHIIVIKISRLLFGSGTELYIIWVYLPPVDSSFYEVSDFNSH